MATSPIVNSPSLQTPNFLERAGAPGALSSSEVRTTHSPHVRASRLDSGEFDLQPDLNSKYHFRAVSRQISSDNKCQESSRAGRVLNSLFGYTAARRVSNFFSALGLGVLFEAERTHSVLPPDCVLRSSDGGFLKVDSKVQTAAMLADRYAPSFKTISEAHSVDKETQICTLRYEVLPPKHKDDAYHIIYFVGRPREALPIPVLGRIYDWARVVLYGTQKDWEPLQVDISRKTGKPERVFFETSNYSANASSFDSVFENNLHLIAKVEKQSDDSWHHVVQQKSGAKKTVRVDDPFKYGRFPLVFVSWNGLYDLEEVAREKSTGALDEVDQLTFYPLEQVRPEFMDIETFCEEGIDLRARWLEPHKAGETVLWISRKNQDAEKPETLHLLSDEWPQMARSLNHKSLITPEYN